MRQMKLFIKICLIRNPSRMYTKDIEGDLFCINLELSESAYVYHAITGHHFLVPFASLLWDWTTTMCRLQMDLMEY